MNILDIFNLECQLLLMIGVGFFLARINVLDASARKKLSTLMFYVILPCNTFNAFGKAFPTDAIAQCGIVLIAATVVEIVCVCGSPLFFKPFKKSEQLVMTAGLINPNPTFVGLPIIIAIYEEIGVLYYNMTLLPFRIFIWVAIVAMFEKYTGVANNGKKENVVLRLLKTPVIIALLLGFVRLFLQPTLPVFLDKTIASFSNCTSAISMLIIGAALGSSNLRGIFTKATVWFSTVRLMVLPLATFGVMTLCKCDPVVTGVVTLLVGTPAGVTTPTLAQKYDCEPTLCAQTVTCSTVLMLITLPILMYLVAA